MNRFIDSQQLFDWTADRLWKFDPRPLAYAWNSGENCLLFGPGGYGKSVGAEMMYTFMIEQGVMPLDTKPFVLSFSQNMTEERLFGGVDLRQFKDEGRIHYLLQYAFTQHEVVIFEEIWDAFPGILLTLKDVLTSGYVRNGAQYEPIKTRLIIANSNKSREEVVQDNSTEALFQRFVFEHLVKWDSHLENDYKQAFKRNSHINDLESKWVAIIAAASSKDGNTISPRTAFKALKSARINGIKSLSYFFGLAKYVAELQHEINKAEDQTKRQAELLEKVQTTLVEAEKWISGVEQMRNSAMERMALGHSPVMDLMFLARRIYDKAKSIPTVSDNDDLMQRQLALVGKLSQEFTSTMDALHVAVKRFNPVANPGSALEAIITGKTNEEIILKVQLPTFGTAQAKLKR